MSVKIWKIIGIVRAEKTDAVKQQLGGGVIISKIIIFSRQNILLKRKSQKKDK